MYKVEAFIEKCLLSSLHQDIPYSEYEIICVNDGSPDKSADIAKEIAKKHDNINVIDQDNGGLSAARNTGLKSASGDYVWFVDSDDWIKENCLKRIVDTCEVLNLDMLQICAANMKGDEPVRRFYRKDDGNVIKGRDVLRRGIAFCAPFSIYKRKFLIENHLFFYEGIFHEDNEFSPRVFFKAERVSSINDVVYFVYQNPNSITRSFNPKKAFDSIKVVKNLHDFQIKEDPGKRNCFNKVIARTLNTSLHEVIQLEKQMQRDFSAELFANKFLYEHLIYSGKTTYKIEGFLMKLFPKNPIAVYRFLNIFDRRRGTKHN